MFKPWDQLTEQEQLACEYSDFFKGVYGYRPRHDYINNSVEWFKEEFKYLNVELEHVMALEKEEELRNIATFEARLTDVIDSGARDRATAIRWMMEAEYCEGDISYFCFKCGLPYDYFK